MAMQSAVRRTSAVVAHLSGQVSPRALSTAATAASSSSPVSFVTPQDALSSTPLPSAAETASRDLARQLLPFNYGRVIDEPSGQVLQAVGHQSQRSAKAGAKVPALFSPLTIRSRAKGAASSSSAAAPITLTLKNRVVVSPMCTYSSDDGFLNDFHLVHLGQFALGGAALVIVEATAVSAEGRISPVDSGLWKEEHVGPLKRLARFLASQDCRAGIQLAHAGRKASGMPLPLMPRAPSVLKLNAGSDLGGWPEDIKAPSALPFTPETHMPHEMSTEEIRVVVRQFGEAAQRASKAGFEYIEIHAAHGYLLSSFLSPSSNKRTDSYGGSIANRARFLLEVISEIRRVYQGVLGVRLSCSEWTPDGWSMDDTIALVALMEPLGIDVVDASSGGLNAKQSIAPSQLVAGYQVPFARAIKAAHPALTVGAVGLISDPAHADRIVSSGDADLVLLAREFLRHPHWTMDAARALGFEMSWAPQYQRAAPSTKLQSLP